jgi:hypothetical protein
MILHLGWVCIQKGGQSVRFLSHLPRDGRARAVRALEISHQDLDRAVATPSVNGSRVRCVNSARDQHRLCCAVQESGCGVVETGSAEGSEADVLRPCRKNATTLFSTFPMSVPSLSW